MFEYNNSVGTPALYEYLGSDSRIYLVFRARTSTINGSLGKRCDSRCSALLHGKCRQRRRVFNEVGSKSFAVLGRPYITVLLDKARSRVGPLFNRRVSGKLFSHIYLCRCGPCPGTHDLEGRPNALSVPRQFAIVNGSFRRQLAQLCGTSAVGTRCLARPRREL